jgi:hypothetical protein
LPRALTRLHGLIEDRLAARILVEARGGHQLTLGGGAAPDQDEGKARDGRLYGHLKHGSSLIRSKAWIIVGDTPTTRYGKAK